ncbi:unnamed protein product, partial [marine sediment metagenome]
MLEVGARDMVCKVSGLVSPPSLARSNRGYLSFFVNRRWVHTPLLMRATEEAYHGLLMDGKHPMAIINISLPPEEIDVNVHPTKAQVKFRRGQAVFASTEEAVKGALAKAPIAKSGAMPLSATSWQEIASLRSQREGMIKEKEPTFIAPLPAPGLPVLRVMGQLANTYIIAEGPEGLFIIDSPGREPEALTALAAAGAQVILFSTGLGAPQGFPFAPVIKITANPITYQHLPDHMDLYIDITSGASHTLK